MQHIVLFSGGIQSSYVAEMICRQEQNIVLLFHDTRTEPADNYRFRKDVSNHLGVPITEVSDGRNIWQLFDDMHFLGNNRVPICSRELKSKQSKVFYDGLDEDFIIYYGFTANEYRRAQKVYSRYPKLSIKFPLIDNTSLTKDWIRNEIIQRWGICLPEMYHWFNHANCVPCVRWGKRYWKECFLHYPQAYQRAKQAEKTHGYTIMKQMSLHEFEKEIHVNQLQFDNEMMLPCICAI